MQPNKNEKKLFRIIIIIIIVIVLIAFENADCFTVWGEWGDRILLEVILCMRGGDKGREIENNHYRQGILCISETGGGGN